MDDTEDEEPLSPVVALTNCILIAALNKRAHQIRIDGDKRRCVVTFRINGVDREEMSPPSTMRPYIVRRLAVMGSVPFYPLDGSGEGEILLRVGEHPERPRFSLRVSGHGSNLTATLDVLEGYDPWPP